MSDVNSNRAPSFREMLLQAWQGEVYGIEVYGALAERLRVPVEAAKMRELVVLEEHMERQLADLLERLGIELDLDDTMAVADQDIRDQASSSWHDLLRWLANQASISLGEYQPMVQLLPSGDEETRRVVTDVLAHEQALITFCAKELAGQDDSLAEVRALMLGVDQ
jgi:hypothetical protein